MQEIIKFVSQHLGLVLMAVVVIVLLLGVELIRIRRKGFYIDSPRMIQKMNHENAVVIDIRPTEMYQKAHIIGAISIPAQDLHAHPEKLEKFKDKPIILICEAGESACKLAAMFYQQQYDTYSLQGGIRNWNKADMPLVKES